MNKQPSSAKKIGGRRRRPRPETKKRNEDEGFLVVVLVMNLESKMSYQSAFEIRPEDVQPVRESGSWAEVLGVKSPRANEITENTESFMKHLGGQCMVEMRIGKFE